MPHKAALYDLISRTDPSASGGTVKRALEVIRSHLGMEVAYVSEFVGDKSVFREIDAPGMEDRIKVGDSYSLDDVYCRHILEGRLPQVIPDTSAEPVAAAMPITQAVPVGSHISVPIKLSDGSTYGMFCCLGLTPDKSLNARDLNMMKAFADLAAFEIDRDVQAKRASEQNQARIQGTIDGKQFSIVYQPIWSIDPLRPIGLESLTRFSEMPSRTPDVWFNEAAESGLGAELEIAAIRMALGALDALPDHAYLAVNASPATILRPEFHEVFKDIPAERVVLEVTEHAHVKDYDELMRSLKPLRERGVRLAVDDAGAGYSSLQHILHLRPDKIKLDMTLTRHVDLDPARRALATALIRFAKDTGSRIIAEGVETQSELNTLRTLGADAAQGYHLAKPMTLDRAASLFEADAAFHAQVA